MGTSPTNIDTVLKETRVFEPSQEFKKNALHSNKEQYETLLRQAKENPVAYWEKAAKDLTWDKPWTRALEWEEPFAKWFTGGQLNASVNCLDRHLAKNGKKKALIFEAESGETQTYTYEQLHAEVCRFSNALEAQGLGAGDTAAIYLPLIPEAVVAMLACARIGVAHNVIFAGFASNAIRDRVQDADCKVIITCDFAYRKGQTLDLLKTVEEAAKECPTVKNVLVLRRKSTTELKGNQLDWAKVINGQSTSHQAKSFDSENKLFFLYTSGTTGKPKGIVHTTGGYLTGAMRSAGWVFDLKADDIYWCTADIGWITGHSYVVYGMLANAATVFIYEGALNFPHGGRIWELIDKHKVTILYTAPTAIRSFMRSAESDPNKFKLGTLRLLGSVGEPINPEAWVWYHENVGKGKCPIVDTWWQTETGTIMITPVPGVTATKPGSATRPLPGITAEIVNEEGKILGPNEGGYLVITSPWPSMLRGIHKDPARYKETYWSKFKGMYFTGDGAHKDQDGFFWIKGRIDDVLNVSGHRLGTMEIESALVSHPLVAEAAVVGRPDDLKGQGIVAFVTPKDIVERSAIKQLGLDLKLHVAKEIGAIARPDEIKFTKALPKTRSGKIMRRLLKDLAAGKAITGDTTTLENPGVVDLMEP